MKRTYYQTTLVCLSLCVLAALQVRPSTTNAGVEKKLFSAKLSNAPGNSLTSVLVTYAPGGKSTSHHHAGSVYAYVVSGEIRSQNSATGPVRVYKQGESFFEPEGSTHVVSENASTKEPASLLAIFIAKDGATLTTPDK